MTRNWEETFQSWAKPPGKTEQEKCERAETGIRKAVASSSALTQRSIAVLAQGSYRNRTNVRQDSDVDICILCRDSFFFDLPEGYKPEDFGFKTPADYSYPCFKNDVYEALIGSFTPAGVTRGNKAFDVHENSYRVDADAVACFEYRWYRKDGTYLKGTSFSPDSGERVINWPQQNYENGVAKNEATDRRFKAIVRILKRLRNQMAENDHAIAEDIPSFLIECLVWNVSNEGFGYSTLRADVQYSLAQLIDETASYEKCKDWREINQLKYLFRSSQPWTREAANLFLNAAWNYIGFNH